MTFLKSAEGVVATTGSPFALYREGNPARAHASSKSRRRQVSRKLSVWRVVRIYISIPRATPSNHKGGCTFALVAGV